MCRIQPGTKDRADGCSCTGPWSHCKGRVSFGLQITWTYDTKLAGTLLYDNTPFCNVLQSTVMYLEVLDTGKQAGQVEDAAKCLSSSQHC